MTSTTQHEDFVNVKPFTILIMRPPDLQIVYSMFNMFVNTSLDPTLPFQAAFSTGFGVLPATYHDKGSVFVAKASYLSDSGALSLLSGPSV